MTEEMHRQILDRMPVGYALHKIIIDDGGSPCDYEYVEANRAFEDATGLVAAEIIGKRVTEVIPNIKNDEFDWINTYSEVALKGQTLDFEQHSSSLNKLFKVKAFSPKVGFFVTLVNDVTKENETNRKLTMEIRKHIALQSALTRDAVFATQANLTQNKVLRGLEFYDEFLERIHYDYDAWFDYAKSNVQREYSDIYSESLERQKLIDNFNKGIEPKPFEYRRIGNDNWIRLVLRVFKDVESDDVYVFGYGFDIDNEVRDRQALMLSAQTDLFTGLYNKATTENLIGVEIRKGAGILFLIDIDDFKNVNDGFGHEAGDCVLKYFSDLLRDVFRKDDIVGRVGGDEFIVYIKNTTDISVAEEKVSEILTRLKIGVDYDGIKIIVSVSIGISVIDEKIGSFSEAYRQADNAMYQAKGKGKNK